MYNILEFMKTITLTFPDGKQIQIENSISPVSILNYFETADSEIVAVKVNNLICPLDSPIDITAELKPVYLKSKDGSAIYRRSLCFVLATAAHNIFPEKHLLVGHSLDYGYYYTLDDEKPVTENEIDLLKKEMERIVNEDELISSEFISYKDACSHFEKLGLTETRKQLNYHCPPRVRINILEGFSDLYFGPLLSHTGILKTFELLKYNEGFLLRFPKKETPDHLTEFKDQPKLFEIYRQYKQWGKRLEVTSAASINQLIHDRKEKDFIDITETLQVKCISEIANQIYARKTTRVVLIAGPSSSGKTTTSKKLALQLEAIGYKPKVISLDNYYVGRDKTPLDENGKPDFECLEALDVPLLNQNLIDLFEGKTIELPSYDFHEGARFYEGKTMALGENDILVMEGIHGLNDKLTPLIPSELKFKIYLSALTQLNLDDHNRIPTSDNRLIRRIVRDAKYRNKSAAETIAMWDSVQKGERKHIFPFQNNADAMLNTALDYELPVLKVYADPLLRCVSPLQEEYSEASRLLEFLNNFSTIPATAVPNQSIIREFIGGSAFHY